MKIAKLEAIPYRLPLRGTLQWGKHSQLSRADHVLVRVWLENGMCGEAEAPPRPTIYGETILSIQGALEQLSPALLGCEIEDLAAIEAALKPLVNNHTAKGALDMACWDARAKSAGSGLFSSLAGPNQQIKVSYILGIADQSTMLEEAKRVFAAGVQVFKVKVGRDHAKDLEVIRALRFELGGAGSGLELYADSNETLVADNAPKALEAMREAGLLYVEEPLPVHHIKARAELKRHAILPIIADDSCFTPSDLERELDFDTFDVLNIKTARTGFTQSLKMLALARQAGKGVMVGSQASTTLGTVHAALISSQVGVTHPCELSFPLKLEAEVINQGIRFENGLIAWAGLSEIRVDAKKLEAHRLV